MPADKSETGETIVAVDPLFVRASEIVSSLDDHLLVMQVLICGIDGRGNLPIHTRDRLSAHPPGGIMLFRYNVNTSNDDIQNLLSQTASVILEKSGIPPFFAIDHEGGTVTRFNRGIAVLPSAHTYWDYFLEYGLEPALEKIESDSFSAGSEIFELGVNMNFAPVAEHIIDKNRDFLRFRSYGPDPVFTARAAAAFVRGMERAGVLCVVKHFPGSAGPDPHYSASVLEGDKAFLDSLAYPFKYLIDGGARSIMVAHSAVPLMDSEIASLSMIIMENWLRAELGFNGLIISDDFIMAAAGGLNPEEAAVKSIIAGSDMILVWPRDVISTHTAILAALEDGSLPRERLEQAVRRIVYEKLKMGMLM